MSVSTRDYLPAWLRGVPEDWPTPLLRLVARVESGHTPSRSHPEYWIPDECTIPWFSLADIWQLRDGRQTFLGETQEMVSPTGIANSSARILPAGTVVLSRTASVGFSGIMPREMATTQDFVNFVCGPKLMPRFLLWVFRGMTSEFDRIRMGSTHQTIYMPDVMQFRVPTPSIRLQTSIADFLDRKTAAIDALIGKKERLLELLTEKRAALIHQAVTKGLDPDVPMKESGVPWIGEIPEHWEVKRLYQVVATYRQVMYGIVLPGPHFEGGVPIVKAGNCVPGGLRLSKLRRTDPKIEEGYVRSRLMPDDIVFSIRGSYGSAAIVPSDLEGANLTQDAARISPASGIVSRWLWYVATSSVFSGYLNPRVVGATVKGVNIWDLKRVLVPAPDSKEQAEIADWLDVQIGSAARIEEAVQTQITRLREYRQALITAAVTGQIEVPDLPEKEGVA
ncbi:MAG: restriction endonuclease subunit S [Acidobacteria bacterium]|nr:restriction endonuclease subunit S [Acidobacteriota bacterium]